MKRFTETNIWDEDWWLDIPPEYKLFWFYLKDKCNHAGIWRPNSRLFEVMIGVKIDLKIALDYFNKDKLRCEILKSGHWFILDFFVFQYGETFNIANRVHKSIQDIYNQEQIVLRSIRGLKDLKDGVKDKDKDKDKYLEKGVKGEKQTSEKSKDFIDEIVDCFSQSYSENFKIDYVITNQGKEKGCAGKILKLYKEKWPESNSEETLKSLKTYFDACCQINDNWLSTNMSLSIIISKFNEINNKLKNGNKPGRNGRGTTDEELAGLVAKHFATDYTKQ
ncbi:MAG TPA: hypothetical protein VGB37_08635 [Candidatus Lokiarchaeia archaeon]